MKPSLATDARTMMTPTMSASIDASATAFCGSPSDATSGRTVAAIIGPERGVRPQHQDAGRAEDRVGEQAQDGGVQPGDRGQPGQLRVGHALGNQQRRQDDPGDDVLAEPVSSGTSRRRRARHQLAQPALPPLSGLGHICTLPGAAARCILRRG